VIRSCPCARAGLGEPGDDRFLAGDVDVAEDAADRPRDFLALLSVDVEHRDFRTCRGERFGARLAQAGRRSGNHGGSRRINPHPALSQFNRAIKPG